MFAMVPSVLRIKEVAKGNLGEHKRTTYPLLSDAIRGKDLRSKSAECPTPQTLFAFGICCVLQFTYAKLSKKFFCTLVLW